MKKVPDIREIVQNLVRGAAVLRKKTHDHGGPVHPGYDLKPGFMRSLMLFIATGCGTGFSPVASGTAGCIPGIIIFWLMNPSYYGWAAYVLACILVVGLGVLTANAAEGIYQKKDDGRIVIDEVAGYMITMLGAAHSWKAAALGFLLFRFFDITKLPPAHRLQTLKGGWGIMVDDVVAGIYSCVSLHLILSVVRTFA